MFEFTLRKLEFNDLNLVLAWRNSDAIRHCMLNDKLITWDEHLRWFHNLQNSNRDFQIFCVNESPVGVVNFVYIDEKVGKDCYWGFYVSEEVAYKSVGLLLGYYGIEHVFRKYSIEKIKSKVISFNKISCNFHERLLFLRSGIEENAVVRDENVYDLILYELNKEDWQRSSKKILHDALFKFRASN